MTRRICPRAWIAAVLFPLSLSACLADLGSGSDPSTGVEEVTSALTNTNTLIDSHLVTKYGADLAVGSGVDRILPVWTVFDAAGAPQVAGQPFGFNGHTTGHALDVDGVQPTLHVYSNTARPKSSFAVANENSTNHFLVVWQDDFSSSDSDIWGAIVNDLGDLIDFGPDHPNPFSINFDTDVEKFPTVTFVKDANSFLVTYTRKVVAENRTALTTQWVNFDGDTDPVLVDVVPSGVSQTASRPTTAFVPAQGMILFTWNDTKYGWGPVEDPVIDTVNSISGAVGLSAAGNDAPAASSYALTWRTGNNASAKIMGRLFPHGCQSPGCAAADTTIMTAGSGVTNLHNPVISAASLGYGVSAGSEGTVWHIRYGQFGGATGSSASITPDCAGALQSANGKSLGSNGVLATTTTSNSGGTAVRAFMFYDSFCGTPAAQAKEWVAAPNSTPPHSGPITDVLNFNVSMNGNGMQ